MDFEKKIKALFARLSKEDVRCGSKHLLLHSKINTGNMIRLVEGDLSHIGDAILEGKEILYVQKDGYSHLIEYPCDFSMEAARYAIAEEFITVNDTLVHAPMQVEPEHGMIYFYPNPSKELCFAWRYWFDEQADERLFASGLCFSDKQHVIDYAKAIGWLK